MPALGFWFAPAMRRPSAKAPAVDGPSPVDFSGAALDPRLTFSRGSAATRVGPAGMIVPVAADVARIDYDPATRARIGVLIESQRTNHALRSAELDLNGSGNPWLAPSGATIAANAATAPDGTSAAELLTETGDNAQHVLRQGGTAGASALQVVSIFAKAYGSAHRRLVLRPFGIGTGAAFASFDVAAATRAAAGGTAFLSAGKAAFADGWLRASMAAHYDTAPSNLSFNLADDDSEYPTYAGDPAAGLYLWGAQIETGAFPTSYIPTGAIATTRAADVCSSTHADFRAWLAREEKTVAIEADSPASGTRRVLHAAKTGCEATDYISIWTSDATVKAAVAAGGAVQAELTLGTIATGVPFRIALCLAANGVRASLNGAPTVTGAAPAIPACDTLWFGSGPDGDCLCGHLRGTWRFMKGTGDVRALSG